MKNFSICQPLAIHQFPSDLFNQTQRREGAVLLHLFIAIYIFGCLAHLCDTYYVPSLEMLSDKLKLRTDVAGATLMAIGSSSPELFTSIIGVFIAKDDIGLGAIIGSAVFNIMFVIGCCVFVAPGHLSLEVWPVVRDVMYYSFALLPLLLVTMDRTVNWYDGILLVAMYGLYILVMYFNQTLECFFYRFFPALEGTKLTIASHSPVESSEEQNKATVLDLPASNTETAPCAFSSGDDEKTALIQDGNNTESVHHKKPPNYQASESYNQSVRYMSFNGDKLLYTGKETFFAGVLTPPRSWGKRVIWGVGLPSILLFAITLPNPTSKRWSFLYPLTFIFSLFYMGGLTYVLVWMVTIIGYTIGISDIVVGLVFLAAGASVPDTLGSIIVAKEGQGKMSVSNCIGSNIFDVLVGLGLPWILKTLVVNYRSQIQIHSYSVHYTILILLSSVVALLIVFSISRWQLRRTSGVALICLYIIFITISCLFETNVLGHLNPPNC